MFAKTGQPSYAGITAETYVGAERQYVELQNGTGKIVLPFMAGEVNLVMHPAIQGFRCMSSPSALESVRRKGGKPHDGH